MTVFNTVGTAKKKTKKRNLVFSLCRSLGNKFVSQFVCEAIRKVENVMEIVQFYDENFYCFTKRLLPLLKI